MTKNLQIQLAQQPEGNPVPSDFNPVEVDIPALKDGEFLIKNEALSLDPYQRGAISGMHLGHTKLDPGDVIYGRTIGEVVDSKHPGYKVGETVLSESGWQSYFVSNDDPHDEVRKVDTVHADKGAYLGVLGMPGLTAYCGVEYLGKPTLGETFVVTAAAGPVGGTAGQVAKNKGCRVVGVAGSDEKCKLVVDEYGFDACINYRNADWSDQLKAACPDGVDVYYDNVGGPVLDTIMMHFNLYARVVMCGIQFKYNDRDPGGFTGHNLGMYVGKRAQLMGMVVYDYYDKFPLFWQRVGPLVADGRIKIQEDRVDGLEHAPEHFAKLMRGENVGKALVGIN